MAVFAVVLLCASGCSAHVTPSPSVSSAAVSSPGPFSVPLRDSDGARVLHMEVQIESTPLVEEKIAAHQAQIRAVILKRAGAYSYEELQDVDGKMRLRDDVQRALNELLAPDRVLRISFTSFGVQ